MMGETKIDIPVDRILTAALAEDLGSAVVLGWRKEEGYMFFASSLASSTEVLWLLKLAKNQLLEIGDA